jgi:hypothetical protein
MGYLAVDIFTVAHTDDFDDKDMVINGIDDSIVSDA